MSEASDLAVELRHAASDGVYVGNKLPLQAASLLESQEREIAELIAALEEAKEDVMCWGAYAGDYFQDKHDLEGDIKRIGDTIARARARATGKESGE